MNVMNLANENREYTIGLRRHFHQYPETGWEEFETQKRIKQELDTLGIPYVEVLGTGLVATLEGNKKHPIIGLRTDIDALPVKEDTGLSFASKIEGKSHACGHDGHMAMLLTTAKILSENKDKLNCTVKFIFQPAEELAAGAKEFAKQPEVQDIDNFMAIHIWSPIPVGKISVQAGPRMSSCDMFYLTIKGESGHGAFPDTAIDPIPCAAALVSNLQTIVSREIAPTEPAVVSVCSLNAGNKFNVIPGEAKLSGTTRSFSPEVHAMIPEAMERIIGNTCNAFRTTYDFEYVRGTLPVINEVNSSRRAEAAVRNTLGEDALIDYPKFTGAEDFSYFMQNKPGYLAFVGGGKIHGPVYPHHHEKFDIDEQGLVNGVALFVQYVLETQDDLK
ncbi:TPA: amidohydrolase [Enterococcus faecalis]|uniref:M20 metallopeptidase family protein n=1 Tax=Listeria seeligeri TaxID=1640 RepID=UPI00188923CE|nr:amidohydrolase [Listeria seeligeri]MBF2543576.1 amidohydrolase [Listeria seeligeri]MBF2642495.1 amidohydrolase [Listeria seeligeri]HCQ8729837.1 amidohydrolase [Enterococcus faecalis]